MAIEDTWEGEILKDIRTAVEKIPDPWSGTAHSKKVETTNLTVERWETVETRMKRIQFMNRYPTNDLTFAAALGLYNSSPTTFRSTCYVLYPGRTITFQNIDLYTLGYASYIDYNTVPLISGGTRE